MSKPVLETAPAADGVNIAFRRIDGTGDLIVAIHGFTGDSSTMLELVQRSRNGRPALVVDVVGHGHSESPSHLEHYSMTSVVDQILSLIGPYPPSTVHVMGYSMGGRIALSMAARAPWYFASITTLSATPGIEDPVERAARYDADHALAGELEAQGIESFVDNWLELSLFAPYIATLSADDLADTKHQRSQNNPAGLANSLRGTGTGSMPPVWNMLSSIHSPLLAVAGELDEKYVALARRMSEMAPSGQCKVIAGVGHVVHHENLQAVASVVSSFLTECGSHADH